MFNKNFKKEPTDKQKIGQIGEDTATVYLEKAGHKILTRNYLRKWGELDVVTLKSGIVHFIEVKSVTRDLGVIHETYDSFRPEDNMHPWKLKRLRRVIQSYILEKDIESDWQFDLVTVYIDPAKGESKVIMLEDIVI